MKIPSQVIILGQPFDIIMKPQAEMEDELGCCQVTYNTIFLRQDMKDEKMGEVLLHEIIHAVGENLNLDLTENQVNNLAVGLYPIFRHQRLDLTD